MADPRKTVAYDLIGQKRATFKYGNTIVYDPLNPTKFDNRAVILSADDTVQLVADAELIFGWIILVEQDGFCTVAYDGFVQALKGAAATLTIGLGVIGSLGGVGGTEKGFVKVGAPGRGYVVNDNDANNIIVCLAR